MTHDPLYNTPAPALTHLPECDPDLRLLARNVEWVDDETGEVECAICHALRECEARVREDERRRQAHVCPDNNCCMGDPE